jgi:ABC-type lipoprotein release transport system permease subunit
MAIPLSYNFRNLFRRPVSTATTVVGVGLTVTIFIGAMALAAGFQSVLLKTGSPKNVIVLRKGADSEISSAVSRDAANIIRATPWIATAPDGRPLASAEVVVIVAKDRRDRSGSANIIVRGIDPGALLLRDQVKIVQGKMFAPGTSEVIVGKSVADRFPGFALGDQIRFGQQVVTVVGHFAAAGTSFESEVWGDNAVLMPAFRGDVFQTLTFRLKDPSQFDQMKKALESDPRLQVAVKRESEFYSGQSEVLATLIRFIGTFITVIMAIGAAFGAMNTMYAAVGSRLRDISMLLVLGFSSASILLSFLIESVLLSLMGGLVGCLLSLPINGLVASTTNFVSFSEVTFAFRVTPQILTNAMIAAAVMGVVGGFLPALRAARQQLAVGLRGE